MSFSRNCRDFVSATSAAFVLLVSAGAFAQTASVDSASAAPPSAEPAAAPAAELAPAAEVASGMVRFAFDRASWREVIGWISEEADLALHMGEVPTGSFSYVDADEFTHQQAIDRINLFLLPEGFTLVRSGKLLSVINLADPRSMQQLDALAELVSIEELSGRPAHDVIKCMFPLGDLDAAAAVQELSVLKLISTPQVLSKTNQLIITETAGKLLTVKKILDSFRTIDTPAPTVVRSFTLQHVNAEEILIAARPHLGLAQDEAIGIDISISSDILGKKLLVTGVEDKVKLLEELIATIDVQDSAQSLDIGPTELRNHVVEGGDVQTVYNVLQTLLAGKNNVRLSMDVKAGSVVALTTPEIQREIADTVAKLRSSTAEFEVIPLKTADPIRVKGTLQAMLGLSENGGENVDLNAPKIETDLVNRTLIIQAKRPQIDQITKIVQGLETQASDVDVAVIPLKTAEPEVVKKAVQSLLGLTDQQGDPESADPNASRIDVDPVNRSLQVRATVPQIEQITKIVESMELQAAEADFEAIPLRNLNPRLVISLLEELLDLPGPLDEPSEEMPPAPKLDADPGSRTLFVRGSRPQIEQIKKFIEELEQSGANDAKGQLRVIPLKGPQAEQILESAVKFWQGGNPIIVYSPIGNPDSKANERVLTDDAPTSMSQQESQPLEPESPQLLTANLTSQSPAIRCQVTPRGVVMQSEDASALDRFEEHLASVSGPVESIASSTPIIFYLKYTRAEDAIRMLSELLQGGATVSDLAQNTLVNGYVSSPGSIWGSYVSSQEGTMTLTSGTLTVVADARLNRLIAQGTASEIEQVEGYLKIVDKQNSITSIEAFGVPQVIQLVNAEASEVAKSLREAFAGRVIKDESSQASPAAQAGRPAPTQPPAEADPKLLKRQAVLDREPRMTIAVHEASNSLIVSAPQQLFAEVEAMAKALDAGAEEAVEVVMPSNGVVFETILQRLVDKTPTKR